MEIRSLDIPTIPFKTCDVPGGSKLVTLSESIFPCIPETDYVLMYSLYEVTIYDINYEIIQTYSIRSKITTCTLGLVGHQILLICGLITGEIIIFTPDRPSKVLYHKNTITFLKSIQSDKLLSASEDFTLKLWSLVSGGLISILEGHLGGVLCVDFHIIKNFIVSGGRDSRIIIWEGLESTKKTRRPISKYKIHSSFINALKVHDEIFISSESNGIILIWKPLPNHADYCADILLRLNIYSQYFILDHFSNLIIALQGPKTLVIVGLETNSRNNFELIKETECICSYRSLILSYYLIGFKN